MNDDRKDSLVQFRCEASAVKALRLFAKAKGLSMGTLCRMWAMERLQIELESSDGPYMVASLLQRVENAE